MHRKKTANVLFLIIVIGSSGFIFSACKAKFREGMIIFTQVAEKIQSINYINGDSWRYIPQSRIIAIDPCNPEKSVKIISGDFYSARSPEISYDGKFLLFTGQQKENDPWQVWEMNLKNSKIRKVISSEENCTDPAYLPGGRLVFSKSVANDSLKAGHSLFTSNIDGTDIKRITFNPSTYFASDVLQDGRIITISKQIFPDQRDASLMVMRPDGTKSELFYESSAGTSLFSRGYETTDGKIVFIESDRTHQHGGNIISINYNRPLHSHKNLSSQIQGDFNTVFPLHSGSFLVSYRRSDADRYALYEFDPVKKVLGKALYSDSGFDGLEAVEIHAHLRPKKLPSEVNMGVKTGLLLSQDINVLDKQVSDKVPALPKSYKIEIMGVDSSLGVVNTEEDGSFYLKIVADKPFQIRTLDTAGHVMQSCDWIWLRPNERRGCVGCHEDQELVPENRIPRAVQKAPVKVPVHINKIIEKKVELE
jgi:hypothetical protein